jgi:hypothetical protein
MYDVQISEDAVKALAQALAEQRSAAAVASMGYQGPYASSFLRAPEPGPPQAPSDDEYLLDDDDDDDY